MTTTNQANLTKYLSRRRPSGAAELQILRGSEVIARYPVADLDARPIADVSAEVIESTATDADSVGVSQRYSAQWSTDEGRILQAPFSWREGVGVIVPLDGSVTSQIAQMQRHTEAMARVTNEYTSKLLAQSHAMAATALDRHLQAERRLAIVEADNAALRAQLREAESAASGEPIEAPSATEGALMQIVTAYAAANGLIPGTPPA